MSDAARAAVIQEHCKELKLAAVIRDYPALCRQARDGNWANEDLLANYSKPRSPTGVRVPRGACCARRASPM
jgi:hypothetical protein